MSAANVSTRRGWLRAGFGGLLAVGIAVIALISMWILAVPVSGDNVVCAAVYPPAAGCAGDARILPAAAWTVLILIAVAAAILSSRLSWWGIPAGAVLVAVVGCAGYIATFNIRLLLFV